MLTMTWGMIVACPARAGLSRRASGRNTVPGGQALKLQNLPALAALALSPIFITTGCSPDIFGGAAPGLGEAVVEFPATGDMLLSITEADEIGTVKYYGTRGVSSHDLTSFEVDAGDENFVVVLDAQDRPTEITIGDLRITFVYDPDGTFGYTATLAGAVVSSGENLLPGENYLSSSP